MVLLDFAQPIALLDHISRLCQGLEYPESVVVERIGVLTSFEEDALHLVEVILQSVIILAEHAWAELYLEHVSGKFGFGTHFQSTGTLEHLHVHVLSQHLDDLGHQANAAGVNVAYLTLQHWSVHTERNHIGDNATNCSFCHNLI